MDRSGEGHKRTQPTQSDNRGGGGRGRKECTDSLPHPSPASNLSSGILQPSLTGAEAEGTGRGLPTAAGTPPHPPLPISFCGKPRGVVHDPGSLLSAPACDRRASCVPMGGAQRGERAAVNSGRRHGSRRGWVRGRAESSLSPCWRAAAESQLGPGCTGRPRPPSGSIPCHEHQNFFFQVTAISMTIFFTILKQKRNKKVRSDHHHVKPTLWLTFVHCQLSTIFDG